MLFFKIDTPLKASGGTSLEFKGSWKTCLIFKLELKLIVY